MKVLIREKISPHIFKTAEGYLICQDSILARTGKQTYRKNELFMDTDDDSEIEVDRPYDEVFAKETLASFENKPVTIEHPDEDVTIDNYKDYAVGFARDIRQGKTENGEDVIIGNLVITDKDAIEKIESGEMKELSCGYDCDITDDNNPRQTKIRGNHIALCEKGRAGISKIVDSVNDRDLGKVRLKVGQKVKINKSQAPNEILSNQDLLNDEYEIIGFYNKGRVEKEDNVEERFMPFANVVLKGIRSGKQIEVSRFQLTDSMKDDFNQEYAREYRELEQDVKKGSDIYKRVHNKSANQIFGEMGYKNDGDYIYKENGKYTRVISFADFDNVKYYVLENGKIPTGWTLTKINWFFDSMKDSVKDSYVIKRKNKDLYLSEYNDVVSIYSSSIRKYNTEQEAINGISSIQSEWQDLWEIVKIKDSNRDSIRDEDDHIEYDYRNGEVKIKIDNRKIQATGISESQYKKIEKLFEVYGTTYQQVLDLVKKYSRNVFTDSIRDSQPIEYKGYIIVEMYGKIAVMEKGRYAIEYSASSIEDAKAHIDQVLNNKNDRLNDSVKPEKKLYKVNGKYVSAIHPIDAVRQVRDSAISKGDLFKEQGLMEGSSANKFDISSVYYDINDIITGSDGKLKVLYTTYHRIRENIKNEGQKVETYENLARWLPRYPKLNRSNWQQDEITKYRMAFNKSEDSKEDFEKVFYKKYFNRLCEIKEKKGYDRMDTLFNELYNKSEHKLENLERVLKTYDSIQDKVIKDSASYGSYTSGNIVAQIKGYDIVNSAKDGKFTDYFYIGKNGQIINNKKFYNYSEVSDYINHNLKDSIHDESPINIKARLVYRDKTGHITSKEISHDQLERLPIVNGRTTDYSKYAGAGNMPLVPRKELWNQPRLKGFLDPMWDGDAIRYETEYVNNILSI